MPVPTNALWLCASSSSRADAAAAFVALGSTSQLQMDDALSNCRRTGGHRPALGHARRAHAPSATIDFRSAGKVTTSGLSGLYVDGRRDWTD